MEFPNFQHTIRIKNFKSLENTDIEIKPLTFIFGPNSSGKSSFLKTIKFLSSNLVPLNNAETKYNIDKYTELDNYNDLVTDNNEKLDVKFELLFNSHVDETLNKEIKGIIIDYEIKKRLERESIDQYIHQAGFKLDMDSSEFKITKPPLIFYDYEQDEFSEILKQITDEDKTSEINSNDKKGIDGLNKSNNKTRNKSDSNIYCKDERREFNLPFKLKVDFHKNKKNLDLNTLIISWQDFSIEYTRTQNDYDERKNWKTFWNAKISSVKYSKLFEIFNTRLRNLDFSPYLDGAGAEQEILQFLHYLQYKKNSEWEELTLEEKKDFYNTAYFMLMYIYFLCLPIMEGFFDYYHLPTTREIPQHKYYLSKQEFAEDEYYGVLKVFSETTKSNEGIKKFVKKYLRKFNLAADLLIKKLNADAGCAYFLSFKNNSKNNLAEASSGMLQLLPIIFTSYKFRKESKTFLIEQPELHLHPKLQSQLAEFFIDEELIHNKYIIETHSEHIIRKIQVLIAQGKINKNRVAVYYFDNKGGRTNIKKMEMDNRGLFVENWPDGFFDDSANLTMELYEALRMQNREN